MKRKLLALSLMLWVAAASAATVVFTNDTLINPLNTDYDGADIVVSNCVLTLDGPHNVASVRVAGTGTLTHSFDPSGSLSLYAPVTNEAALLVSTNPSTLANSNIVSSSVIVSDLSGMTIYMNSVDYVIGVDGAGRGTIQRTDASSIPDGATVHVSYAYLAEPVNTGLQISIAGDAEVEPGASINVNARGYSEGPGAGASAGSIASGGGGGHGGGGGFGSTSAAAGGQANGLTMLPNELGSGGGSGVGGTGGIGGGRAQLVIGGNLLVNGTILANGANATNSRAGGGSGGSIWLTAQTVSGSGAIRADGGLGEPTLGGGGGGGRVAIDFAVNNFTGVISAFGGSGWQRGGAGTVLLRPNGAAGAVTFDNGGIGGATTLLGVTNAPDLTIKGSASALLNGVQAVGSLVVRSNSHIQLGATALGNLIMNVLADATIEAGATVTMDGRGYAQNTGSGAGALNSSGTAGGGGGHGGFGGAGIPLTGTSAAGGITYDPVSSPSSAGSGGRGVSFFSGGAGGGVIRLSVAGNLQLDGRISADATPGAGSATGGGGGGGIWVDLGGLSGSGTISANGGSGGAPYGGGGGGGRIAVTYTSNSFTGVMLAHGGIGAVGGGAGTVYTAGPAGLALVRLVADNGGIIGTNTDFNLTGIDDALVTGGANATSTLSSVTISNFVIGANSAFLAGQGVTLTATSLTVYAGGTMSAVGTGSSGGGVISPNGSGGGGHGGYGGRGAGGAGGQGASSILGANGPGEPGGFIGNGPVPYGGGVLWIRTSNLQVDGRISANGVGSPTNNNGGGAGGSISISATRISGTGALLADGGSGHLPLGGGGGGGQILISCPTNLFTGIISAKGAPGYNGGGAGTIMLSRNDGNAPTVLVDNGGLAAGTNTVVDSPGVIGDLRILGGACAIIISPTLSCTTLTLGTNSILSGAYSSTINLLVSSNADISGWLSFDGAGTGSQGNGSTGQTGSGGGGYGGYGGRGLGAVGGFTFGSIAQPSSFGGRGGGSTSPSGGGGALRITVTRTLNVNGRISANGLPGVATNNTWNGGGAGGTIFLTTGGISGNGSIAADGATGALPNGGGGGGGRIAVYYSSNSFTGTFSARGGTGYMNGGAGTVYLKRQDRPSGDLVIDNGGLRGTNSLDGGGLTSFGNFSLSGGALVTSSAGNLSISNLTVGANATLQLGTLLGPSATLNISGSAVIASLGFLSCDGMGGGGGFGSTGSSGVSGGGHGGYGGAGIGVAGGTAFDSPAAPLSGGGWGGGPFGGQGGGAIKMNVMKLLQVDGTLSANGLTASTNIHSGGGAGGSLWLTVGGLAGSGIISGNGGAGKFATDGGGGGGRIAIYYGSNSFTGQLAALGGAGYVRGGAGTLYLKANTNQLAQVTVDNGGVRGTNTGLQNIDFYDLIVQGGGVAFAPGSAATVSLRSLVLHSNGWVSQTGGLSVSDNATIEAGGGIMVDGLGNDPFGTGFSSTTQAGGGGHGGYGGLHQSPRGGVYDSVLSPVRSGAAGGNSSGATLPQIGGLGGGALQLNVNGTLRIDGSVSANGLDGDSMSGGGSGGSLWLSIGTLSGSGTITARGGNGNNANGGGGGGRLAIYYATNTFIGSVFTCGGSGYEAGGAGTIYLKANNQPGDLLILDNCGFSGASTPLSQSLGLGKNVVVGNGALGQFQGVLPALGNLTINAGGQLTGSVSDTNLNGAVLGNLLIATGAVLRVDTLGFAQAQGPGAGNSLSSKGSGAGYGGPGGNSGSGAAGGASYGSLTLPLDRGSGGGLGSGPTPGGSEGGGALRLSVGGQLTIDGMLGANGGDGLQDDSGGGAGGSILLMAHALAGNGSISANGGNGELYGGGGGAAGRIALYSPANTFTGQISFDGGMGAFNGNSGTLYTSAVLPGLQVVGQTPSGIVSNSVNQITMEFSSPLDSTTVSATDFTLYSPSGTVPPSPLGLSFPAASTLRIAVPYQNLSGAYRLELGPNISDIFGQSMSQVYTGSFTISIPAITGRITDTNGSPVSGVLLHQDNGPLTARSDANGAYVLGVDPGWTGTVIPSLSPLVFVPGTRTYTNVVASMTGQDYLAVNSLALTLGSGLRGTTFALNWFAISGATYQPQYSTNLVDWSPYAGPIMGTNGPAEVLIPIDGDPRKFFRISTSN
jgi:hypothetical protein